MWEVLALMGHEALAIGGARLHVPSPRQDMPIRIDTCRQTLRETRRKSASSPKTMYWSRSTNSHRCVVSTVSTSSFLALSSNKAETSQWPTWPSRPSGALPPKPNGCVGICNSIVSHGFTFATSRTMRRTRKGTWPTDALPLLDASQKTLSTTVHFTTRCLHPVARLGADELQKSRSLEACFGALRVWRVRRMVS